MAQATMMGKGTPGGRRASQDLSVEPAGCRPGRPQRSPGPGGGRGLPGTHWLIMPPLKCSHCPHPQVGTEGCVHTPPPITDSSPTTSALEVVTAKCLQLSSSGLWGSVPYSSQQEKACPSRVPLVPLLPAWSSWLSLSLCRTEGKNWEILGVVFQAN